MRQHFDTLSDQAEGDKACLVSLFNLYSTRQLFLPRCTSVAWQQGSDRFFFYNATKLK